MSAPAQITIAPWTCPSCNKVVPSRFCPACGEEPHGPQEFTLRGLAATAVHGLTSVDARVARSTWCLLRHPGELTSKWIAGVRKPYVAPFQLFLIANVLFFALQWATGMNVFSSSLDSHLHHQDWSELAKTLVDRKLARSGASLESYALVFDRSVVLNAKSLIVLMTIPFALLLPLVFLGARRPFAVHVAFSLHHYTFLLLLFCAAMIAAKASALLGTGGLDSPLVDDVLTIFNLGACAIYLYIAIGTVYSARGTLRFVKTIVLTVAVGGIVLAYRFALFLITLFGTV